MMKEKWPTFIPNGSLSIYFEVWMPGPERASGKSDSPLSTIPVFLP
jgi:hypothetical protein